MWHTSIVDYSIPNKYLIILNVCSRKRGPVLGTGFFSLTDEVAFRKVLTSVPTTIPFIEGMSCHLYGDYLFHFQFLRMQMSLCIHFNR